jgi:hypothetical protein
VYPYEVSSDKMVTAVSSSVIQQVMPLSNAMLPPGHVLAIPNVIAAQTAIPANALAPVVHAALAQLSAAFTDRPDELPSCILVLAGQFTAVNCTVVLFQPQPLRELANTVLRTLIACNIFDFSLSFSSRWFLFCVQVTCIRLASTPMCAS